MTSLSDAKAAQAREAGLAQRARLLEMVWKDVQGDRRALGTGALPPRLIADSVTGRTALDRYAADLLCCPDGVWRVARDYVGLHAGAGLLEAPVLAAFLPGLCRLLLGEALRLPSLPVWWLGELDIRPLLASDSRRFSIRDGFDPNGQPVALANLPLARRRWLQATIDADPSRFVAVLNLGFTLPIQHVRFLTERGMLNSYC